MSYRLRSRRDFLLGTATGLLATPFYRAIERGVGGTGNGIPAGTATIPTRAHLAATSPDAKLIYLTEPGREGMFRWDNSNLSAQVTADGQQGIYLAASLDASGAAGAWVRQFEGPMHAKWFGAAIDGAADDTDAYRGLAALHLLSGGEVDLGAGTANVRREIRFAGSIAIHGDVTLDASMAPVNEIDFPVQSDGTQSGLIFDGGDLDALPHLARNHGVGDQMLEFASAHGLQPGYTITLWHSAPGSYSGWRNEYHDGEHARVADVVSETKVMLDRRLRAKLPAAFTRCFRRPMASVKLIGLLRYRAPPALHTGCRLRHLDSSFIDGLDISGGASAALALQKCFGVTGRGIRTMHYGSLEGTSYGLLVGNSQGVNLTGGTFRGRRHAVTLGGDAAAGAVPCRDIDIHGEYANDPSSGVTAVNVHGNSEDYIFRGVSHGGVSLGGDRGAFQGEARNAAGTDLYTIHFTELLGTSFKLDASRVYSSGNPNAGGKARGVINLGGGEQSMNAETVRGGIISLRNVELHCPEANRPIVMRNRGCTTSSVIGIDMTGLKLLKSAAAPVLVFSPVAGKAWDVIWTADMKLPRNAGWSGSADAVNESRRAE